ncbi:hypothetical protein F4604DRAFT_63041 [Suillus subluteus]|nr:hypothetical protein F4604DRAFT_63041 [Suillus subluteus]
MPCKVRFDMRWFSTLTRSRAATIFLLQLNVSSSVRDALMSFHLTRMLCSKTKSASDDGDMGAFHLFLFISTFLHDSWLCIVQHVLLNSPVLPEFIKPGSFKARPRHS